MSAVIFYHLSRDKHHKPQRYEISWRILELLSYKTSNFFFVFFSDWCQAHVQDLGTDCITLSVHPSFQCSFAQTHSNTAIWTCLVDPPGSVEGVFQFPGVQHKQTRERWSCQIYWFPTTAALTGLTQMLLQTHRVGSDGGAGQLYLLWLHETGRSFRS